MTSVQVSHSFTWKLMQVNGFPVSKRANDRCYGDEKCMVQLSFKVKERGNKAAGVSKIKVISKPGCIGTRMAILFIERVKSKSLFRSIKDDRTNKDKHSETVKIFFVLLDK